MTDYLCWNENKAEELLAQGNTVYSLVPIKQFLKVFIIGSGLASSMAGARRLLKSGAIDIDNRKIDPNSKFIALVQDN